MKCLLWNIEWASRRSKRGCRIAEAISGHDPDVLCLTETTVGILPEGHAILSESNYGYSNDGSRRKVALWSKTPWSEVDVVGDEALPTGRYVSGVTCGIRFVGICIPWKDAHVHSGRRDRKPWQDHLQFLEGLARILKLSAKTRTPVCVLGDYNQRIPAKGQPLAVWAALKMAFPECFGIATAGVVDENGDPLIDHLAHTSDISVAVDPCLPKVTPDGLKLTDHVGVIVDLTVKDKNFLSRH